MLAKLTSARLLRPIDREGEAAYELVHEYLIRGIILGAEDKARKEAEELVEQEVRNPPHLRSPLSSQKLAFVNQRRDMLRLTASAQELLLRSALELGYEVDYWLERVKDPQRRVSILAEAAHSPLPSSRCVR